MALGVDMYGEMASRSSFTTGYDTFHNPGEVKKKGIPFRVKWLWFFYSTEGNLFITKVLILSVLAHIMYTCSLVFYTYLAFHKIAASIRKEDTYLNQTLWPGMTPRDLTILGLSLIHI